MALVKKQNANGWYYAEDSSDSNMNKGITTGLNSNATVNSQPSGNFTAGNNKINGANPSSPSTNNATRREKYNLGSDNMYRPSDPNNVEYNPNLENPTRYVGEEGIAYIPEKGWETTLGGYRAPTHPISTPQETTGRRELKSYYDDLGGKEALDEINAIFNEKGISTGTQYFREMYGDAQAEALENVMQANVDLGKAITEKRGYLGHTSVNADRVVKLADEVYKAVAYNSVNGIKNDINEIARNTGATPEEVQAIITGDAYRLIELTDEYKQREFRDYYRKGEDLSLEMEYNRNAFQNTKKYTDYQFESTMNKLERSLFDSERATRTQSAIYGMTGTRYALDRIRKQYEEQMNDVTQSYQYQSAQAQLNINYALQNYGNAMVRLDQDLDYATQEAQKLALQEMTNLNNAVGLSFQQQKSILLNLQKQIDQIKATGLQAALEQWEEGNTTLGNQIAEAYGLNIGDLTTHKFTSSELGRTSTSTIGNDTNNLGHILASDDGMRVGTYKSPNGYTYNVYATREEGLLATQGLLERAYYGKTLRQAAQKWIGQGKDISVAVSVMKGLGLNPDAVLSDDNVRQFMEAIGRWEGTIKKGETLDDWLKGGKDLGGTSGGTEGTGTYNSDYSKDYERYLTDGWDSFKSSTQEDLIKQFGSMDNFIKSAKAYSKAVVQPEQAKTFQDSLDLLVEFKNRWDELNDTQKALIKKLGTEGNFAQNWLYGSKVNSVINLYKQIKAQSFIDNIVASKKKGATYGPLSDNEGTKITDAANELNLNAPKDVNARLDEMMGDLAQAITELGYTPDITTGRQRNVGLVNTSTVFNQGGTAYGAGSVAGTNYTGAYQSGTVNTGAQQMW